MQPASRYFYQASLLAALTAILSLAFQLSAIAAAADARPPELIGWKTERVKNPVFGSPWHTEGDPLWIEVQVLVYAETQDTILPPPPPPQDCGPMLVAEEMPLFPGCEDARDYTEKKICADKKMMEFIHSNLRIPPVLRQNCFKGTLIISFIVERNGSISEATVVRSILAEVDKEALRVINLINERGLKFNPGKNGGRPQRVRLNIPIKINWM